MLNWLGEKRGYERLKRAWRGIDEPSTGFYPRGG